uniref:VWFA domain-containing protein n=1 Tax=Leptobrachium leishanense TaxID=445787 RepID=A0A8C5QX18_9ANUR
MTINVSFLVKSFLQKKKRASGNLLLLAAVCQIRLPCVEFSSQRRVPEVQQISSRMSPQTRRCIHVGQPPSAAKVLPSTAPTSLRRKPTSRRTGSFMAHHVVMLNFNPSFPEAEEQCTCGEFIFLMDRSGSMQEQMNSKPNSPQRIQSAKDTLILLLRSLPLGSYFNVFSFGSGFQSFFPKSVEYTQKSMEKAWRKVKEMEANFGGTEILEPLNHIYKTRSRPGHPRQLFVFTDGEVGNTRSVIEVVQKNAKNHRCFTFGIGEGASTALLKGMARAGNGTADFITSNDRMQPRVLRALKHAIQPIVEDVALKWSLPPDLDSDLLSEIPHAIFQGHRCILYAQVKGKVDFPATGSVSLEYRYKDEVFQNVLPLSFDVGKAERPTIHRLAAKTLISELEDRDFSDSEETKKRILETSLQSGVISSLTAFLAVNKDTTQLVDCDPLRWDIPSTGRKVITTPATCSILTFRDRMCRGNSKSTEISVLFHLARFGDLNSLNSAFTVGSPKCAEWIR